MSTNLSAAGDYPHTGAAGILPAFGGRPLFYGQLEYYKSFSGFIDYHKPEGFPVCEKQLQKAQFHAIMF